METQEKLSKLPTLTQLINRASDIHIQAVTV